LNRDIEGIELLRKAEKIDDEVNIGTDRILDDKTLRKIKILQLKEGVKKVDRHGFRDDDGDKMANNAQKEAIRNEYYHKMLELIKQKRGSKWDEDNEEGNEADYEGDAEMGEDEMSEDEFMMQEEGEAEMDEGEEEGEEEDEEVPEAVPISKQGVNNERRVFSDASESGSEVSDIDVDDYGSSSDDYNSDELNVNTTANPHGFVYGNMLETFKKGRAERLGELRETYDKDSHRDKFKKKQASKKIGKSEKVH